MILEEQPSLGTSEVKTEKKCHTYDLFKNKKMFSTRDKTDFVFRNIKMFSTLMTKLYCNSFLLSRGQTVMFFVEYALLKTRYYQCLSRAATQGSLEEDTSLHSKVQTKNTSREAT